MPTVDEYRDRGEPQYSALDNLFTKMKFWNGCGSGKQLDVDGMPLEFFNKAQMRRHIQTEIKKTRCKSEL